ncbi:MAG TPA: HEAT repeat domain-containing protein, partial [Polyangiaceae bacterium]|nr:HEAT repeat domain-containing protein [Polyangiaceae bacterium]
ELHVHAEAKTIVAAMRRGALPAAAALHALSGAGTAAEVPVVLEFIGDPSPVVRKEAIDAAMLLLDPNQPDGRAVEPLGAVLRDTRPSTQERARIASLLGRTGAPRAAAFLLDLARTADVTLRVAAIDALGTLGPAGADGVLLAALDSADAGVRLRAAVALSEAGAAEAREGLLARLDGGDEVDRAAVLTAVGGVLERAPTDDAVERLSGALDLAAGPERDAIVEAFGRAPSASAVRALTALTRAPDPADRRQAATLLAAHAGDAAAAAAARALLADVDPTVRAQAAWSLGSIGEAADVPALESVAGGADADAAADAAAAIGRIAARARSTELASRALCARLSDARRYVRANALTGLALAGAGCGDGSLARGLLSDDPSEDVRVAAAALVARGKAGEDARALERCARADPSGAVAARCRSRAPPPARTHWALVYVIAEGNTTPRAAAGYAMLMGDGTVRAGTTDRRGAVFDPVAPDGLLTLRPTRNVAF